MVWVLVAAIWVGLAVATAMAAQRRGHDRVLWLVLGLVFPGAAWAALVLGHPRTHVPPSRVAPDVAEALHTSRVARALARRPGLDASGLEAATGLPAERVAAELRTLRFLGLVRRSGGGTWQLAPRAAAELAGDTTSEP